MSTKSLSIKKTPIYVKQRGLHFPTLKLIGSLIRNEQVAPSLSHLRRPDRWLKGYVSHYWTKYQDREPANDALGISPNWDPRMAGYGWIIAPFRSMIPFKRMDMESGWWFSTLVFQQTHPGWPWMDVVRIAIPVEEAERAEDPWVF